MQCTGNSGCFPRGRKASSHSTALPISFVFSCVQCFCVSVIHQSQSNMDYRIFNVHTYILMHAYTHDTNESAHFLFRKSHNFCVCSGQDSNLLSWNPLDLEADVIEPPRPLLHNDDDDDGDDGTFRCKCQLHAPTGQCTNFTMRMRMMREREEWEREGREDKRKEKREKEG